MSGTWMYIDVPVGLLWFCWFWHTSESNLQQISWLQVKSFRHATMRVDHEDPDRSYQCDISLDGASYGGHQEGSQVA